MEAQVHCLTCHRPYETFKVALTQQRWKLAECPHGHKMCIIFEAPGWARLFERGVERLADNATRDAVIDAYTAFEMYLAEVPVRAGYDGKLGATPSEMRNAFRTSVDTAEHAIGAARAVATMLTGNPAPKWKPDITTNLRNKAVHAGAYPSVREAEVLCGELVRVILEFDAVLAGQKCVNEVPFQNAVWLEDAEAMKLAHPDIEPTYTSGGVFLAPRANPTPAAFAQHLADCRIVASLRG